MARRRKKERDPNKPKRFAQIRDAYRLTRKSHPRIGLVLIAIFFSVLLLAIGIGFLFGHPVYAGFMASPLALLATTFFFSRKAERAAYAQIEGEMGAGASVLMAIRRGWTTTPAVAVNRSQDMIHRSVGRPGVVLVAEGGAGLSALLKDERRKTERYVPGTPIHIVLVGVGEGRVPIHKLQRHVQKLPRALSPAQLREVRNRLKAVGGMSVPLPKGPMPKNLRPPRQR